MKRPRVLVHLTGGLGDTLVALPALRIVRATLPDAELLLLHNPGRAGAVVPQDLLRVGEHVDGVVAYEAPGRGLSGWLALTHRVAGLRPNLAVSLAHAERTAAALRRDRAFFRLCGARRLIGFQPFGDDELLRRDARGALVALHHEADWRIERLRRSGWDVEPRRAAAFARPFVTCDASERACVAAWLRVRGDAGARAFVAVAPCTPMPAKSWPLERFEDLGRRLLAHPEIQPIVVGGRADRPIGERLLAAWGRGWNAAGAFSPRETAALLERCALLVGVDSGSVHLAAAIGCPTVVLSSAHRPAGQWAPLGTGHTVLRQRVPSEGCRLSVCPLADHPCMTGLTVDQVLDSVLTALAPGGPSHERLRGTQP